MKLPIIVGVAGTNGSGKDTLGDLLAEHAGYKQVSLSNILRQILDEREKPHTRENLSGVSREIREQDGDEGLAIRTLEANQDQKLCLTSIRTPGEARAIQQHGGVVVWIDADQKIRYERVQAANRGRNEDNITFEEFQDHEHAEMYPSEQGGGLNMAGVRDVADITIINEFESKEAYIEYLRSEFEL